MACYLIVDDNRAFADNLAEILRDAGHDALAVSSGRNALQLLHTLCFDAIVTDMAMREMSGLELLRGLRRIDPGMPAIVVTAHPESREVEAARREGILAALPKNVAIPALVALLERARRDAIVAVIAADGGLRAAAVERLRARGFSTIATATLDEAKAFAAAPLRATVVEGAFAEEAAARLGEPFATLPLVPLGDTGAAVDAIERLHANRWQAPAESRRAACQ